MKDHSISFMFEPEERQSILERVLERLQDDARIAGVVLVGSGAVGFEDRFSDIDLSVVVREEEQTQRVYRDWKGKIMEILPVAHCFETTYGPNTFLYGFLLENFLEIDMGFLHLGNLIAKRRRWEVIFDRSGRIKDIMEESWASRTKPEGRETYIRKVNPIWYYITHVMIFIHRGQRWRALHFLEEIRNRAILLACLRYGLDEGDFRQVDRLPGYFLAGLESTLAKGTGKGELVRALRETTDCFFRQVRALDEIYGLTLAGNLETKMGIYLESFDQHLKKM
jgi:predicted nucleotidyltransferase